MPAPIFDRAQHATADHGETCGRRRISNREIDAIQRVSYCETPADVISFGDAGGALGFWSEGIMRKNVQSDAGDNVDRGDISTKITGAHCRTNSRRGYTNPFDRSYPPVNSVCRALHVLKVLNQKRIATVNAIYADTRIPRPTIVRMLETLMHEGYVVRDNMCGGYRVTEQVAELSEGYSGISRVIEVARPLSIGLTRQIKWPIGLGVLDDDAVEILYWTGTISPVVHTNTVLRKRADLLKSAMGRAYMAFCDEDERERHIVRIRKSFSVEFGVKEELAFRNRLDRIRRAGYAVRDPRTEPLRMTTFGVPIMEMDKVAAVMSVSFFKSSVAPNRVKEEVLSPLLETRTNIEHALDFIGNRAGLDASVHREYPVAP